VGWRVVEAVNAADVSEGMLAPLAGFVAVR